MYRTILENGQAEIIEKKSRFIASVKPIKDEDDAKTFIDEIRKKHWNATHNVFAYQLGEKNEIQRFSDDGEPQGTAGKPVLAVLLGEDIKNCCIVVTRFFGGTLLGTGGLVRAYGKCAKEGLYKAQIIEVAVYKEFSILVDYSLQGKIQYKILEGGYTIKDTIFTDKVEFVVMVEEGKKEGFAKEIINTSSAKADVKILKTIKGTWLGEDFREII